MSEEPSSVRPFGTLTWPIAAITAVLGLIGSLKSYAETLGWKIVAGVSFVAFLAWAIRYASAKTSEPSRLAGVCPTIRYRHGRKHRFAALLLPALILAVGVTGVIRTEQPDYSPLFQGGGPYSPVVVFDSSPPGAQVRIAWIIYGEDDPGLERKDLADHIFHLGPTPCRTRVDQGQYWAVFELRGKRVDIPFEAMGHTVVRADFRHLSGSVLHP
jgi:hypothetical protein